MAYFYNYGGNLGIMFECKKKTADGSVSETYDYIVEATVPIPYVDEKQAEGCHASLQFEKKDGHVVLCFYSGWEQGLDENGNWFEHVSGEKIAETRWENRKEHGVCTYVTECGTDHNIPDETPWDELFDVGNLSDEWKQPVLSLFYSITEEKNDTKKNGLDNRGFIDGRLLITPFLILLSLVWVMIVIEIGNSYNTKAALQEEVSAGTESSEFDHVTVTVTDKDCKTSVNAMPLYINENLSFFPWSDDEYVVYCKDAEGNYASYQISGVLSDQETLYAGLEVGKEYRLTVDDGILYRYVETEAESTSETEGL